MSGAREAPSSPDRLPGSEQGSGAGLQAAQSHVRDLAALLAMPAVWRDRDAAFIGGGLLDVLIGLLRLDVVYLEVTDDAGRTLLEDCRPVTAGSPDRVRQMLEESEAAQSKGGREAGPARAPRPNVARFACRLANANGEVIVASGQPGFPSASQSFLIRTAIDQAMLAIRTSRLVTELRTANAAKASFLATMSHELRTPLNAIIGYSELLHAEIGGTLSEMHRGHVARIDAASRHLLHIIEGILGFSRLEAGKEEVTLSDASAHKLSGAALELIEPLARAKQLSVSVSLPPEDRRLRTDVPKVRQILLNLLSNAVKFTREGTVSLELQYHDDRILWTVRDTGVGISPEDVELVFEPFRQVGDTHTSRAPGTGLGLTVSRRLAMLLGGDVSCVSTPGEGSAFSLSLPLTGHESGRR